MSAEEKIVIFQDFVEYIDGKRKYVGIYMDKLFICELIVYYLVLKTTFCLNRKHLPKQDVKSSLVMFSSFRKRYFRKVIHYTISTTTLYSLNIIIIF